MTRMGNSSSWAVIGWNAGRNSPAIFTTTRCIYRHQPHARTTAKCGVDARIVREDVEAAMRAFEILKASGVNGIHADMLKQVRRRTHNFISGYVPAYIVNENVSRTAVKRTGDINAEERRHQYIRQNDVTTSLISQPGKTVLLFKITQDEIVESTDMASGYIPNRRLDERRLKAAEMWCYRIILRISCTQKRTNKSILDEVQSRNELHAQIIKRKIAFFGHVCRDNMCNPVKTCILGTITSSKILLT